MSITYKTVNSIEGPLIVLKASHPVMNGEIVKITTPAGNQTFGRVVKIEEDIVVVQSFIDNIGLNVEETSVTFLDKLYKIGISSDMIGKTFDGLGKLRATAGVEPDFEIIPEVYRDINGSAINPAKRAYPKDIIQTGVSVIDGINTLIRGQKLPIFTGQGLPHNKLAAQIVKQSKVITNEPFLIIFVGIGILQDDAIFFEQKFKESGNFQNVISFINLSTDPTIERILVPRIALTVAEYFAFDLDMHVLVILDDMTNYCEALRELSAAKEEIPGRKGFPGHLYSDLASIYERAGRIRNKKGSITQIPIVTMPNDDITHPIPDLTGYITEGQLVFSRELHRRGVYPPMDILASISRLMKDGIGAGKTREDHRDVFNQLFEFYSKSIELMELESVIGEEGLSTLDRKILEFGKLFETRFIGQGYEEDRDINETLDIAWDILAIIPKRNLTRIKPELIKKYYKEKY
ncbi:MAG: V-type ATP synthase subunit B [Promethearchaeota archaeon]